MQEILVSEDAMQPGELDEQLPGTDRPSKI